jgi:hypothetical protein
MALFENKKAAQNFAAMNRSEQQEILQKTHDVHSKSEMRALVRQIGGNSNG